MQLKEHHPVLLPITGIIFEIIFFFSVAFYFVNLYNSLSTTVLKKKEKVS